ncbi:hypothetical protein LBMAG43_05140 [Methylococcaceae bacterium]|nr:hypothetical protein LBMAG43_05140 [Methylococcaceae bacterium]
MKQFVVAFYLSVISISAYSMEETTGSTIVEGAREYGRYNQGFKDIDTNSTLMYSGFVLGVANVLSISKLSCFPSKTDGDQVISIVTKYILANPEEWNLKGVQLVSNGITSTFSCKTEHRSSEKTDNSRSY